MKTSEFIKAVEGMNCMGFKVVESESYYFVHNESNNRVASINKRNDFCLNTDYAHFETMDYGLRCNLFQILTAYASTPISEREPEKRYWLRLNVPIVTNNKLTFLNKNIHDKQYMLSDEKEILGYKTIFTESELETMDTAGFERVEVKE